MRQVLLWAVRFYPRWWRDRYEREFLALLEDAAPSWQTVFDVFKGAIAMQIGSANLRTAGGILIAVALMGALLISRAWPADYRSDAVILPDWPRLNAQAASVMSVHNLADIVVGSKLYERDRAKASLNDLALKLRSSVLLVAVPAVDASGRTLEIRVSAPDAAQAQRAAAGIAQGFVKANAASLVEQATLPDHPNRPPFEAALIVSLLIGAMAGMLYFLIRPLNAWKVASLLGLCGAVLGVAAASALPRTFAGLSVVSSRTTDAAAAHDLVSIAASPDILASLVRQFHLYPGDPRPEHRLAQNLDIRPDLRPSGNPLTQTERGSYDIRIGFRYPDPTTAQLVTEAIAAQLTGADTRRPASIAGEIVAPAFVHTAPPAPLRTIFSIAGLLVGIIAAGLLNYGRPLTARLGFESA